MEKTQHLNLLSTINYGLILTFSSLLFFSCSKKQDAYPTAQNIVNASLEKMGGIANLQKILTLTTVANCTSPEGKYSIETHSTSDGYLYFKQVYDYKEGSYIAVIYDSLNGYQFDYADQGIKSLSPATIQILKGHEFHKVAIEVNQRFRELLVVDEVLLEDIPCYRITCFDDGGYPASLYFSKESKLLHEVSILNPADTLENIRVRFEDWHKQDEILFAYKVIVLQDELKEYTFNFETIEVNVEGVNL